MTDPAQPEAATPDPARSLLLTDPERRALWARVSEEVERYLGEVGRAPVAPPLSVEAVRGRLGPLAFETPMAPEEAVAFAVEGLWTQQVHTPHPRYFGLFNPAPTAMGVAADTLVAAFNPQLAAWSHNPFANELERHLLRAFGTRFGYDAEVVDGTFCSGGAEANHTAVLMALTRAFPAFAEEGVRALDGAPVLYASSQSHHSFVKAARFCGLGTSALREVPTDAHHRLDPERLEAMIREDRAAGRLPFLIAATGGTTNAGVIDPIAPLAELAEREGVWLHVDAAWGGAAALLPELRGALAGIERADSITFDAHKWLSVPMGAGMVLTRHATALHEACRITTAYMPKDAAGLDVTDPYAHSLQWSRRFIGLKLFLSLAVAGWEGYAAVLRRQVALGEELRERLAVAGWRVVNATPLPVVLFEDELPREEGGADPEAVAEAVVRSGAAWLSTTRLDAGPPVLRACVTNYRSDSEDVEALVAALGRARLELRANLPAGAR